MAWILVAAFSTCGSFKSMSIYVCEREKKDGKRRKKTKERKISNKELLKEKKIFQSQKVKCDSW